MGHPDNGQIQALLDGELTSGEAEEIQGHLADCGECRTEVQALEAASRAVVGALDLLDVEPVLGPARAGFLAGAEKVLPATKVGSAEAVKPKNRGRARQLGWTSWSLPKAASVALLLTAATVSALPGSPVRRWATQALEALTGSPAATEVPSPEAETGISAELQGTPETGAGIPGLAGGVEIWITDLPDGAGLRVLWTDGEEAWAYAGEGTRFNSVDGRLEVFSPPGAVRLEIPRIFQRVVVGLDGGVLLRKAGGELEILAPVQEQTPSEIRFEAPSSTNDGQG